MPRPPAPGSMATFADALRRVDHLLLRAVRRQRARLGMEGDRNAWGRNIRDDEAEAILRDHGEIEVPVWAGTEWLDQLVEDTRPHVPTLAGRLGDLARRFGLEAIDLDILLLAAAPEVSAGYGKVFAWLHENVAAPFLSVDLTTRVIATGRLERLDVAGHLLPGARLVEDGLITLTPGPDAGPQALRRVSIPARLLHWLLGDGPMNYGTGVVRLPIDGEPFVPAACAADLARLDLPGALDDLDADERLIQPLTLCIVGGMPGMREGVAMGVAKRLGRREIVRVDIERCKGYLEDPVALRRDLQAAGDVAYLCNVPDMTDDPVMRERLIHLGTELARLPRPLCLGSRDRRSLSAMLGGTRTIVDLKVGRVTTAERAAAWQGALDREGWTEIDANDLALRFAAVGGTTMDRVITEVGRLLSPDEQPSPEAVRAACREATKPDMSGLVQHIIPRYAWGDVVLPDKILGQLRQLEDVLAHQETVLHTWRREKIRPRGYGLKALFTGAPGTGKTMCAEVIAGSLGYDMYKVDLSSVVSKWVGETEKNLREIFDAAEGGTSVLLFDEGDAIFGTRGESKSAQDKYANQEVAYLLQRLEVFEGCVIITTNLQENIDEAFLRRFSSVIEFPFPGPAERAALWTRALPDGELAAPDLDTRALGRQFQLAGGSIVNAALNACIQAAKEGEAVGMRHCIVAVARELTKMGKQVNRVTFGDWLPEVERMFA